MKHFLASLHQKIIFGVFLLVICTAGSTSGEEEETKRRAELKTIFSGPAGEFPSLGSCEMGFKISWKDTLEAGEFTIKIGETGDKLELSPQYKTKHPVFDLIAAALFIRSQALSDPGESYTLVVIPKSTAGPFTATMIGREKHEFKGEMIDSIPN